MERPEGFPDPPPGDTVWRLRRPVYGLRQAPRQWHAKLRQTLLAMGFTPSHSDPSLFIRHTPSGLFILVYVDDMTLVSDDLEALTAFKQQLQAQFAMKDLGELTHYLGMDITRDRQARTITISQSRYLHSVLCKFGMEEATPVATPLPEKHELTTPAIPSSIPCSHPYPELIGSLMYAMVCTRPDLAFPLSILSRYVGQGRYTEAHWEAAKRVLRYLKGTLEKGLTLGGQGPICLEGFSDSSWADDQTDRRSTQGYGFSLGSGLISWRSTRSSAVALSSCEAELYAGTMAAQELQWLSTLLQELGYPQQGPTLWCDNMSTIALARDNGVYHARTKHIDLRFFFIRDMVQEGTIRVRHVTSAENVADIFTKALGREDHHRLLARLGLH